MVFKVRTSPLCRGLTSAAIAKVWSGALSGDSLLPRDGRGGILIISYSVRKASTEGVSWLGLVGVGET